MLAPVDATTLAGANTVGTNVSSAPPRRRRGVQDHRLDDRQRRASCACTSTESNRDHGSRSASMPTTSASPGALLGSGPIASVSPGHGTTSAARRRRPDRRTGLLARPCSIRSAATARCLARPRGRRRRRGADEPRSAVAADCPRSGRSSGSYSDGPMSGYVIGARRTLPAPPSLGVVADRVDVRATQAARTRPARRWPCPTPAAARCIHRVVGPAVAVGHPGLRDGARGPDRLRQHARARRRHLHRLLTVDAGSAAGSPKMIPVTLTVAAGDPGARGDADDSSRSTRSPAREPCGARRSPSPTAAGHAVLHRVRRRAWLSVTRPAAPRRPR